MATKEDIIGFLQEDKIKNINMINFIESYPIHYMERFKDSVVVKGKSDENWVYLSSSSEEELKTLLMRCEEDEFFVITEDWMLPLILENREIDWKLSCMKLVFPDDKELPKCKHDIRKLKPKDAEYIFRGSKYKEYTSIEYITHRIENGVALGIYEGEKLIAWLMTHDDGAIGFLNVLPEYRKKGYGYDLTISMIENLRSINEISFVHIEEDNYKSMNLALKTGFVKAGKIHWIKRK
ncbi:GNAT family N-acetyltransferase [Wukongibacter baidiensis]|uniref:GNAT family N-acetyltransferase n=1 Tax=Wukongibacter baidiensis TaxID=1723361 RepID=UPI003D7F192A